MGKIDYSKLDPSMLNKPLSELAITPGEGEKDGGFNGVPVTGIPEGVKDGEKKEETEVAPKSSDEDSKVPYSRFKKFHDRALEAEEEADFWRRKAQQREEVPERESYRAPAPADVEVSFEGADWQKFKNLWGDSDQAKEAYRIEVQRVAAIEERATQRAMDAMERRSSQEQETLRDNLGELDQHLEEASELLGRDLTSDEELALLEIQDDYSPKDRNGNITALIPIEKAVDIWQLQQARSPRRQARNQVAALSGGSSESEGAELSGQQKTDYNPRGGWRQVFGKR